MNEQSKVRKKNKLVYGVGRNDADYLVLPKVNGVVIPCPYYLVWKSMLQRCYHAKCLLKHPTYIGCTVSEDWLTFSNFKAWMELQDWENKSLDKDLLIRHNKLYSEETCIFIPSAINNLLLNSPARKGNYKLGVCWSKKSNKFQAQCAGKNLGVYNSEDEAYSAYLAFKRQFILEIANKQEDTRLKEALSKIAQEFIQ